MSGWSYFESAAQSSLRILPGTEAEGTTGAIVDFRLQLHAIR